MMKKIYRVVIEEYDEADAMECAEEDWDKDARGGSELTREVTRATFAKQRATLKKERHIVASTLIDEEILGIAQEQIRLRADRETTIRDGFAAFLRWRHHTHKSTATSDEHVAPGNSEHRDKGNNRVKGSSKRALRCAGE